MPGERTVSDEIHLINDGDGVAVIGDPSAVERFLAAEELPSKALDRARLGSVLNAGAGTAQAASTITEQSGRWVKLTEQSATALKQTKLMTGSSPGVNRAVLTQNGKVTQFLEIVKPGTVGAMLTNPAVLTGAAGIMAQLAMQQTMEEITDYLAVIDAKVDEVLRAQKDAVLADMIGVELLIDEAMAIREQTGRVSEVTWSKVQATALTIARTQACALRQIDALAQKMERDDRIGDLAKASKEAEAKVQEWLAVLARCFQLQDALAVLELDRVMDAGPDELEQHRLALRAARQKRRDTFARARGTLLERVEQAAGTANSKVLLNPLESRRVVRSCNEVGASVEDFRELLGLDGGHEHVNARRWRDAAADVRDKVLESGADGVDTARRFGVGTLSRARAATGRVSGGISEAAARRRASGAASADERA
jgi:hypothetical protein